MSFTATCPHCEATQRLSDESRGKKVACRDCGESYPARPAARRKSGTSTLTYVVLGSLAFLVLGAGVLLYFLVSRWSADVQPAPLAPAPVPVAKLADADKALKLAQADKAPAVTSDTFRQQFVRDPDGAERKHKDQTLEITGTISSLQELLPLRGVILGTLQDPTPPILFDLTPDQAVTFAKLKPGQRVTIRGVFRSKTAEGFLGFSKCQVVPK